MQRQLRNLLALLLLCLPAHAALSSFVVWETRPGAGSDTQCSGGFDNSVVSPGTDYSQQNAAQVAFTDLVIGATNTQLTSVLNAFTTAYVGNLIQITSGTGFTPGFYTIVSVSGITATMDRAVGTAASVLGNGYLGGALASLQTALVTSSSPVAVAGNIIWQKGTLTVTTAITLNTQSSNLRIQISAYGTTRGDAAQQTITTATNSVNLLTFVNSKGYEFDNFIFSNTAGTPGFGAWATAASSEQITFSNCIFNGFSIGINGNNGSATYEFLNLVLVNTIVENSTAQGIYQAGTTSLYGSQLLNNTGDGFLLQTTVDSPGLYCFDSVASGNGGQGFNNESGALVSWSFIGCSGYGNTGDGVRNGTSGSDVGVVSINSVWYGNGGFGMNFQGIGSGAAAAVMNQQISNAFGANTSGARNTGAPAGINDITLTAAPFVNTSGNWLPNTNAGGGKLLLNAGWPGIIVLGTGSPVVGPLQPASSSGSGGQKGFPIVQ
jgi:hypothetical protein